MDSFRRQNLEEEMFIQSAEKHLLNQYKRCLEDIDHLKDIKKIARENTDYFIELFRKNEISFPQKQCIQELPLLLPLKKEEIDSLNISKHGEEMFHIDAYENPEEIVEKTQKEITRYVSDKYKEKIETWKQRTPRKSTFTTKKITTRHIKWKCWKKEIDKNLLD